VPGAPVTQSCTSGPNAGREYVCNSGTQHCASDYEKQCTCVHAHACPYKWVGAPPTGSSGSRLLAKMRVEGELCLKFEDGVCDLQRDFCATASKGSDSALCNALSQFCPPPA
jgi:hypothetical protein